MASGHHQGKVLQMRFVRKKICKSVLQFLWGNENTHKKLEYFISWAWPQSVESVEQKAEVL